MDTLKNLRQHGHSQKSKLAFIPSLLVYIIKSYFRTPVKENKYRVASCSLPKLWCNKMKTKHTPLSVKWFGHEPFQNDDHIYGDYIYIKMYMCKICYNHDIVEELKNNHYYVCQAITFYIVLSMGGGVCFMVINFLYSSVDGGGGMFYGDTVSWLS